MSERVFILHLPSYLFDSFFLYLDLVVESKKQFDIFDTKNQNTKKENKPQQSRSSLLTSQQFNEDEDKGIDLSWRQKVRTKSKRQHPFLRSYSSCGVNRVTSE